MRLRDILNYIERSTNNGATLDEMQEAFPGEDFDDIKRLVKSALDLSEIKQTGKRYYGLKYHIIKIKTDPIASVAKTAKLIDGAIDVSKCCGTKEQIATILASDHKLTKPHRFSYREKIEGRVLGRDLFDFIHAGIKDTDIGIHHDKTIGKNKMYTKVEKTVFNSLWIGFEENSWVIKKIFNGLTTESVQYPNFAEMEKRLRTLTNK